MRILRQYPVSIEAKQARSILDGLKADDSAARFVATHSHNVKPAALARPPDMPVGDPDEPDWKTLWQRFNRLPYLQKRILMFVLMFIVLFAVFTPFVWVFAVLLILKRTEVKQVFYKILVSIDPEARRK